MSVNWVMLDPSKGFVRLPGEQLVYKSPVRTSLAITTPHAYPAHNPLSIQSKTGTVHLTNQRIIYLPATPTQDFQSFSAPLLNLYDTRVIMPWFGSNSWQAVLQPVPGGNIPPGHAKIEVQLVFNEGGAADFHTNFERIKERLQQAVESARASSNGVGSGIGSMAGVNMDTVHLDQLPSYEASGQDAMAPVLPPDIPQGPPIASPSIHDIPRVTPRATSSLSTSANVEPPREAPPGYEETQQQSIQEAFERRFSEQD